MNRVYIFRYHVNGGFRVIGLGVLPLKMGQATVLRWKTVYVSDHGLCVQAIGLVSMFIGLCNLPSLSHTILLFFFFFYISIVYSCLIKIINNDLILVSLLLNFIAKRIIKTQIGFNNSKCREQKN